MFIYVLGSWYDKLSDSSQTLFIVGISVSASVILLVLSAILRRKYCKKFAPYRRETLAL